MYFPVCDGACKRSPAVNEKRIAHAVAAMGFSLTIRMVLYHV